MAVGMESCRYPAVAVYTRTLGVPAVALTAAARDGMARSADSSNGRGRIMWMVGWRSGQLAEITRIWPTGWKVTSMFHAGCTTLWRLRTLLGMLGPGVHA